MRDLIDLASLMKLKEKFEEDEEMDKETFVASFKDILGGSLSEQQLTHLFLRVDADNSGGVDWDEFTNYMFLSNQEATEGALDKEGKYSLASARSLEFSQRRRPNVRFHHKAPVISMCQIDRYGYVLTAGREGVVKVWNTSTNEHQHSFRTCDTAAQLASRAGSIMEHSNADRTRNKDVRNLIDSSTWNEDSDVGGEDADDEPYKAAADALRKRMKGVPNRTSSSMHATRSSSSTQDWVTSAIYLPTPNKVVLASINQGILFYEITPEHVKRVASIPNSTLDHCAPLCITQMVNQAQNRELLLAGDDAGSVHAFAAENRHWQFTDGQMVDTNGNQIKSVFKYQEHTDHITSIDYVQDLSSTLTASLDATVQVVDMERLTVRRSFAGHTKAVYSFAWSSQYKLVASGGLDRKIIIWSPYSRRSIGSLHGHVAPVISLQMDEQANQLVSMSSDNVVKLWDLRNQRCVQTFSCAESSRTSASHHKPMSKMQKTSIGSGGGGSGGGNGSIEAMNRQLPARNASIMFSARSRSIYTCVTRLNAWQMRQTGEPENSSKERIPMVTAMFNKLFKQVIGVDQLGNLTIWDCENGVKISKFALVQGSKVELGGGIDDNDGESLDLDGDNGSDESNGIGGSKCGATSKWTGGRIDKNNNGDDNNCNMRHHAAVTAVTFDDGGRRLITGSGKGESLCVWNSSNGCLLRKLMKTSEEEIERVRSEATHQQLNLTPQAQLAKAAQHNGTGSHLPSPRVRQNRYISMGQTNNGVHTPTAPKDPNSNSNFGRKIFGGKMLRGRDSGLRMNSRRHSMDAGTTSRAENGKHIDPPDYGPAQVTCILYVVNVQKTVPGHQTLQNKFIVSAGWDRKIYIWSDDQDSDVTHTNEQGYALRLPNPNVQRFTASSTTSSTLSSTPSSTSSSILSSTSSSSPHSKSHSAQLSPQSTQHLFSRQSATQSRSNSKPNSNSTSTSVSHRRLLAVGTGHTETITSIVYVWPNTIVSGGQDHKIMFWNLNSGDRKSVLEISARSVEKLLTLQEMNCVCAGMDGGRIAFVDTSSMRLLVSFDVSLHNAQIVGLATNENNTVLVVGDSLGFVQVFIISSSKNDSTSVVLERTTSWRAHEVGISSIDTIERSNGNLFVVSGSLDGVVYLWTLLGALVGQFGQSVPWSLATVDASARTTSPAHTDEVTADPGAKYNSDSAALIRSLQGNQTKGKRRHRNSHKARNTVPDILVQDATDSIKLMLPPVKRCPFFDSHSADLDPNAQALVNTQSNPLDALLGLGIRDNYALNTENMDRSLPQVESSTAKTESTSSNVTGPVSSNNTETATDNKVLWRKYCTRRLAKYTEGGQQSGSRASNGPRQASGTDAHRAAEEARHQMGRNRRTIHNITKVPTDVAQTRRMLLPQSDLE